MLDPKQVTGILVTKGDHDLSLILASLQCLDDVLVWNNAKESRDLKVYGRYELAASAPTEYVYVQDDDCLIDVERLCREYDPQSDTLLCNMLEGHQRDYARCWPGISLVGWGSIFPKSMIDFTSYLGRYPKDALFHRECDRVFVWLNRQRLRLIDIGVQHLELAHGKDRLSLDPQHGSYLHEVYRRLVGLERQVA